MAVLIIFPTGKLDHITKSILLKGRQLTKSGISVMYVIPPAKELIEIFEEGEHFTTINFYPFLGYWTSQILAPIMDSVEEVIVFRKRHLRIATRATRSMQHNVCIKFQKI